MMVNRYRKEDDVRKKTLIEVKYENTREYTRIRSACKYVLQSVRIFVAVHGIDTNHQIVPRNSGIQESSEEHKVGYK